MLMADESQSIKSPETQLAATAVVVVEERGEQRE